MTTTTYVAAPHANGLAIAAMVLGIVSPALCGVGSILAVVFGHVSLSQIKRSQGRQTGRGFAITGLVLGYIMIGLIMAYFTWAVIVLSDSGGPN